MPCSGARGISRRRRCCGTSAGVLPNFWLRCQAICIDVAIAREAVLGKVLELVVRHEILRALSHSAIWQMLIHGFLSRLAILAQFEPPATRALGESDELVVDHGRHCEQPALRICPLDKAVVSQVSLPFFAAPLAGHPLLLKMADELRLRQMPHHGLVPLPVPVLVKLCVFHPLEDASCSSFQFTV